MSRSIRATNAIHELYAVMAKAAAQRAVDKIGWDKPTEAEQYAIWAIKWLDKSSANAIHWAYDRPRIK